MVTPTELRRRLPRRTANAGIYRRHQILISNIEKAVLHIDFNSSPKRSIGSIESHDMSVSSSLFPRGDEHLGYRVGVEQM